MVPVRNGSFPAAPDGGHNTHVGALFDAAPAALPADPAERVEEEALDRPPVRAVGAADDEPFVPPEVAPVAAFPEVEPAVVVPVAAEDVGCDAVGVGVFAPVVAAVEAAALLPSVTTPRLVAAYGFAVVCAAFRARATTAESLSNRL